MTRAKSEYLVVVGKEVVFSSGSFLESSAFTIGRGEGRVCHVLSEVLSKTPKSNAEKRSDKLKKPAKTS